MAAESISAFRKPNFPKTSKSDRSNQTTIEYIGAAATLSAAEPINGATWGDFSGTVSSTTYEEITGTSPLLAELTVVVEYEFEQGEEPATGTAVGEPTYEVEWMLFTRSLYEHPAFAVGQGGLYELTSADIRAIELWKNQDNEEYSTAYQYETAPGSGEFNYLSDNAIKFTVGLDLGLETFEDYAPVFRRNTTYAGGLPATSNAGLKENPPNASGIPSGYEWRKTADRAIRTGRSKWEKSEEWIGALKVLTDKQNIFF